MNIIILFLLLLFFSTNVFSETSDWNVLRSENGEFSIKMPAECNSQLYVRDGITVPERVRSYHHRLKEMRSISCYREKTLVSVEIFETAFPKAVVKLLKERDRAHGAQTALEMPLTGFKQINSNQNFTLTRHVIAGKKHVYLLTTAKRGERNEIMETFLQSVKLDPDSSANFSDPNEKMVSISSLRIVEPELVDLTDQKSNPVAGSSALTKKAEVKPLSDKMLILHLVSAQYTREARQKQIRGNISLRLDFGADGKINKVEIVRGLSGGLVREAVLAALQTKFLPEEQNDVPRSVTKIIEYRFGSH